MHIEGILRNMMTKKNLMISKMKIPIVPMKGTKQKQLQIIDDFVFICLKKLEKMLYLFMIVFKYHLRIFFQENLQN